MMFQHCFTNSDTHYVHLLQKVNYPYSSSITRDFVELPSQIMENWAFEPEVLKLYAKHYQTGETIPQELLDKIEASKSFISSFATIEYLAACFLDMDWHSIADTLERNVTLFEKESIKKMKLIPEILPKYLSTNFLHIAYWDYECWILQLPLGSKCLMQMRLKHLKKKDCLTGQQQNHSEKIF